MVPVHDMAKCIFIVCSCIDWIIPDRRNISNVGCPGWSTLFTVYIIFSAGSALMDSDLAWVNGKSAR